jgi:hypothetical protein
MKVGTYWRLSFNDTLFGACERSKAVNARQLFTSLKDCVKVKTRSRDVRIERSSSSGVDMSTLRRP